MQLSPGSIAPVARRYPRGHCVPWHAHPWPQLLYASSGVLGVETSKGSWIVPPQRGVWLPPDARHETRMLTDVELSSLYLENTGKWSSDCEVIEISTLLRELVLSAIGLAAGLAIGHNGNAERDDRERLIIQLIGLELGSAKRVGSPIPMPRDPRLIEFCRLVISNPSVEIAIEKNANEVGVTAKTVSRLFQRELGMSFREWRQLAQVAYAIAHLAQGEAVKVVASALGYTPSAFAAMIKRATGRSPVELRAGEDARNAT